MPEKKENITPVVPLPDEQDEKAPAVTLTDEQLDAVTGGENVVNGDIPFGAPITAPSYLHTTGLIYISNP